MRTKELLSQVTETTLKGMIDYSEAELVENAVYISNILKSNIVYLMSWGAEKFHAEIFRDMKALRFRVNGFIHKGYVFVAYNEGTDLFEVYTLTFDLKEVLMCKDVCVDDLCNVIDEMVEQGDMSEEEYEAKINQTYGW